MNTSASSTLTRATSYGAPARLNRSRASSKRPAGVAPLRLHDLRHTCASLAIAAGADVKVLQRMLGHASAALTWTATAT
ncbi:MAG TPA: tyrosine-type recombinase/integrase [Acidimicrobiales bacterium]|nr:tyrosine-type recombinase/integrase [Acidimicrobiales bacterium]